MTQDEEIRRANEAERLLNDPLMAEAFQVTETAIVEALKRAPVADHTTQHELVLSLQVLARIKGHLTTAVQTGKLARLTKEESMSKRLLRAVKG